MTNLPPAIPPEEPGVNLDEIRPVAPPDHLESLSPKHPTDFYSKCVFILAVILALLAVIGSGVAFAGFAENDQNFTHLLSAFALSFGIGALLFGPMGLIAIYAKRAIDKPLPRFRAVIVLLLMLPWFVLAFYVFKLGDIWRIFTITGVFASLFISIWALRFFKTP